MKILMNPESGILKQASEVKDDSVVAMINYMISKLEKIVWILIIWLF